MTGSRVLITGAAGFIGSAVARSLAAAATQVVGVGLDRRPDVNLADWISSGFGIGTLPEERLRGVDAVLHAAWVGFPGTHAGIRTELDRNVGETADLFLRCRAAGVRRFVFLSSGGTVYGEPPSVPIGEDMVLHPISLYGAAKAAAELLLQGLAHSGGIDLVILRLANPFGPGQLPWRGQGVIPTAIACALTGAPLGIWGSSAAERDYVYIDDVVEAIIEVLRDRMRTGIFNVGSGEGTSLDDVIGAVEQATGRPVTRQAEADRGVDVAHNVLDPARFRAAFGWLPRIDFADGVARHRDWLLTHRDRWSAPAR